MNAADRRRKVEEMSDWLTRENERRAFEALGRNIFTGLMLAVGAEMMCRSQVAQ